MTDQSGSPSGVTRRGFLKGVGVAAVAPSILSSSPLSPSQDRAGRVDGPDATTLRLRVNGTEHEVQAEPRTTLLEVLRFSLQLTGAKEVCDQGSCGACTVLLDGKAVNACMVLAIDCEGHDVLTIEGLAPEGDLHPLSQAFVEDDALQCGYCTPGMIMAAHACLSAKPDATREEIVEGISGNLCRCGTYPRIITAVEKAQQRLRGGGR